MIEFRTLSVHDLDGLPCLDRSDYSTTWCVVRDGHVVQEERVFKHHGFSQTEWAGIVGELARQVSKCEMLVIAAYDGSSPVGIAGLDIKHGYGPEMDMYNFGPLWISKEHRGCGIGKRLFSMLQEEAIRRGIDILYISATPVPGTVEFYMRMGCRLIAQPDLDLFAKEPEDIHMSLDCRVA